MTFEQRHGEGEREELSSKRHSQCKGPEAGSGLMAGGQQRPHGWNRSNKQRCGRRSLQMGTLLLLPGAGDPCGSPPRGARALGLLSGWHRDTAGLLASLRLDGRQRSGQLLLRRGRILGGPWAWQAQGSKASETDRPGGCRALTTPRWSEAPTWGPRPCPAVWEDSPQAPCDRAALCTQHLVPD